MESRRRSLFLGLVLAGLLAGCGGVDDRPKLGNVSGTVTLDGKPLPNVWVMFNPTTGRTALGHTDEAGHYELKFTEDADGANLGTHKVVIVTWHEDEIAEQQFNTGKAPKEPIPAKYNSKTELTAEVKAGDNVIDFPLESK